MPFTFKIKTLGCPVNQYEGLAVKKAMEDAGFLATEGKADVYIINSCAVTAQAAAEARRLASQAKRENPHALVVLAGCYPQVYPEEVKERLPQVDVIIGTAGRARLPEILKRRLLQPGACREVQVDPGGPGPDLEDLPPAAPGNRTRPVLKIQEGCDEACTYCVVRVARGRSRSLDPAKVLSRVAELAGAGYREIVLAGNHLGAYGRDMPGWSLARLIREIDALPYDFRLRLSYIEPMDAGEELLLAIAGSSKACPFLYLPLQSGSDRILRKMGRRYTAEEFARTVRRARELMPDASIWSDVIAGFPGETEEDHRKTIDLARALGLSHLHVFPFSPRLGTPAALYPDQVAPDVKKRRVQELRALDGELALRYHRRFPGRTLRVLVEKVEGGTAEGFSEHYVRVRFPVSSGAVARGSLVTVRAVAAHPWGVEGVEARN
ncbi:tRNA (N(6)-L-threonylcarbamoyladenosine(37)-C(2))-methylthiotransferase MtaB [Desulfovirgula thermocuniculi]|uniref:tRNA (N(6)-L-threonylcarbamoyladenosine(37)-C(2))- methylthiotransferase MtaB n=1 Tax=Desulfovirgula thermocuniculi TaxID=348842 RepID=UPI0003FD62EC|nr:tRNA (N(6)-L-threonylcarbamoyladenosine(37)-C(2))-methylthiotransferase MtaB [Desulfovirgula thermocuniculi]